MYHAVMEPPNGCDETERDLFVSPRQFEEQMADLAARGFRSVRLDQFQTGEGRTVLITFDDAYAHLPAMVTPILERYEFSATMFVPTAYLGGRNAWDADEHPRLGALEITSVRQIPEIACGPWEIASHGSRHVDLRTLEPSACLEELTRSRQVLSELSGGPVEALAYPFGYVNDQVEDAARRAGYRMAFEAGPAPGGNPLRLSRQPIRGSDDLRVFRLRTSGWLRRFRAVHRVTPAWARTAVRAAINGVAR